MVYVHEQGSGRALSYNYLVCNPAAIDGTSYWT